MLSYRIKKLRYRNKKMDEIMAKNDFTSTNNTNNVVHKKLKIRSWRDEIMQRSAEVSRVFIRLSK